MRMLIIGLLSCTLSAWENHALLTHWAVLETPELHVSVQAEPLETFLKSGGQKLTELLIQEDRWARAHVPAYAQTRPASFSTSRILTKREFLEGVRLNPEVPLALFRQELPGTLSERKTLLSLDQVTLLPNSLPKTAKQFRALKSGDRVQAREVFVTATDEPDYGLDLKLWEDNGTEFGKRYGYGTQPFGNPKLEFSSQAPFHMGFYHERSVVFMLAPELGRTFPEQRIHLFLALARFAAQTGHPYWAWRFAGWAAHYVQDLTQPYHATLYPRGSSVWLLLAGVLSKVGIDSPKIAIVEEVSEGHLKLEERVYQKSLQAFSDPKHPYRSLLAKKPHELMVYRHPDVRDVLAREAYTLSESLPEHELVMNFGKHTRALVRTVLSSNPL